MNTDFTTEQKIEGLNFKTVDGRGRPVDPDGDPTFTSSDETVAAVANIAKQGKGHWTFDITSSGGVGAYRVLVNADVKDGEEVEAVFAEVTGVVSLDPRTAERRVELTGGTVKDD